MLPGESFSFKLWDERQNMELTLTPITTLAGAGLVYEPDGLTALEMATEPAIPAEFYLSKNFPNPFNSTTTISFGISEGTNVEINIYDISGRVVESLVNGAVKPGHHKITWSPHEASTGIYIVRCVAGGKKESLKVALIR